MQQKKTVHSRKAIFIGTAIVLLLAFALGALVYNRDKLDASAKVAEKNLPYLSRDHSPRSGPEQAKVHLVEFFDPACGTCREFYPLVKELMNANRDKIRLSLRYAPFHAGSDEVVRMLEAARRQDKFWPMLETLLTSQPYWVSNHRALPQFVWPQLGKLGLDLDRMKREMHSPDIDRIISQDLADAKALGVTMTPEFFVNGRPLPEFGYEQLRKLVNNAIAKAY